MVGIAGRSRACLACYRRKIRCDETRPRCKRCLKAEIACPGYKDMTFVSFGISQTGPQRLSKKVAHSERDLHLPATLSLEGSVMLLASDDMCISYARTYLPHTWKDRSLWLLPGTGDRDSKAFIEDNLAQHAYISLARTLFAYRFRQQKLLAQGLSLYRSVISIFQTQLSPGGTKNYKQMVKVAIALRAFDSFIPHNPKAWVGHSLGIEALFSLIGPVACNNEDMRKSLERARPLVIMACLQSRRKTIFAEEQWKLIPWLDPCVTKEEVEYLVDIFADLPAATLQKTGEAHSVDVDIIFQNLHQWKSVGFQKSAELHVHNVKSYVLYLAICTIALHASSPIVSMHKHEKRCTSKSTSKTRDLVEDRQGTCSLLCHDNILPCYHTLLADACRVTCWFTDYKGAAPPPAEILISLRQVWRVTRQIDCQLATEFDTTMTQIMNDPTADLPLFLYTQ